MRAFALSDVLQDFGARPQLAASAVSNPIPVSPPPPSIDEIVRVEVARAEAELEERLSAAHAAELEELRVQHAAQTDSILRQIGQTAGETISKRLERLEEEIGQEASVTVARILGSFMSDELLKRSLDGLAASIRETIAERETFRAEIRAPQSLYEGLQAALGEQAGHFTFIETPGFDLSVTIDGNLFETRLSEWAAILSEILE